MKTNCLVSFAHLIGILLATLFVIAFLLLTPLWSLAAPLTDNTQVGDTVTDPETGIDATVVALLLDPPPAPDYDGEYSLFGVVTDAERIISLEPEVGTVYEAEDDGPDWTVAFDDEENKFFLTRTIETTVADPDNEGEYITETEIETVPLPLSRPINEDEQDTKPDTDDGDPEREIDPPDTAEGDSNTVYVIKKGSNGGNGRDGYGVEVCIPYIGCATIAYSPKPGGDGGIGPEVNVAVSADDGPIEAVSRPGITAVSIGGNGGKGGDQYGNIKGARGGDAGNGGDVTVTSGTRINTSGTKGHGIFAQSKAGYAGDGGSGFIWSDGGSGGSAAAGGTVKVIHQTDGEIYTSGDNAHGIFAQSIGGAAGDGGSSWGIVGEGGSSRIGGNGGSVHVDHYGLIFTRGQGSHGIFAQSLGGEGGDGGDGAGIVALGGDGSAGGNGGQVEATTHEDSYIETQGLGSHGILAQSIGGGGGNGGIGAGIVGIGAEGDGGGNAGKVTVTHKGTVITEATGSYGILAQSIGGGGGNAGFGAGLVGLGATGGGGGNGSSVTVTTQQDSRIWTYGDKSHGILVQSIGGGGGSGGTGAGAVAIGGKGSGGGHGGTVTISNEGNISTGLFDENEELVSGDYSRGIYAQSVGGGGGDGGAGGGIVSIGGSGAKASHGGQVVVDNHGIIITRGFRSDAVYGQSVGGGGGSGGGSGGLISLGGKGGGGGDGGTVTAKNTGILITYSDRSRGIFAQSIGGGGGDGDGSGGGVSIGGSGGDGGTAGNIQVTNSGQITTWGQGSQGIFAQSVGGGGGDGAGSGGIISIGGSGAKASHGGQVVVDNSGSIQTWNDFASALFAHSVGGGGGNGAGSGGAVSLGGSGGGGGNGRAVSVSSSTDLRTSGTDSHGIFAQSVGGGGGNAGGAASGSAFAGLAIGGSGGNGGDSDRVSVSVTSSEKNPGDIILPLIQTKGDRSRGILAQSLGGGGGNGGFAVQGTGGALGSISVAVGGSGGGGGNAAAVDVNAAANIETRGHDAEGIFVQSVGGGGGSGGYAVSGSVQISPTVGGAVAVGIGGAGGDGGKAGNAEIDFTGKIDTFGNNAHGILAQSIGGGGGNGGFSVSSSISGSSGASGAVSVGVGGSGGGGGDGAAVKTDLSADIHTRGDDATALLAQSIGGGGGNGGFNVSSTISGAGTASGGVSVGVGGSGGEGGDGDQIQVDFDGAIATEGEHSAGILAQSIGGGGGNGGFNVSSTISGAGTGSGAIPVGIGGSGEKGGAGGAVNGIVTGQISTLGDHADALVYQSVGGGGGNGGFNVSGAISGAGTGSGTVSVGIGGAGEGGGSGDDVNLDMEAYVRTDGEHSSGVVVQSLGGGGGNGGFNVSGAVSGAGTGSGGVTVGLGGAGGSGGSGGSVSAKLDGYVQTQGNHSNALTIQSLGGGGGNGGFNVSGSISGAGSGSGTVAVGIGGTGGSGGSGGDVSAIITGDKNTLGDDSTAVLVQSVGGGGGDGGFNISGGISGSAKGSGTLAVGVGGFGGSGGRAASVLADVTGTIETHGKNASGAVAQSVGGGGGSGAMNVSGSVSFSRSYSGSVGVGIGGFGGDGGHADQVSLIRTGNTNTYNDASTAVIAQSLGGGGGNGAINVTGSLEATLKGTGGSIGVGIGGFGGSGGDGDDVNLEMDGDVTTAGANAHSVLAQSVGGSGGSGGLNVSAGMAFSGSGNAFSGALGLGGFGGDGGDSGDVNVSIKGNLISGGLKKDDLIVVPDFIVDGVTIPDTGYSYRKMEDGSHGLVAQSIGGGGGNGGINISGGISIANPETGKTGSLAVGFGGFGGDGGDAGAVSASVTADWITAIGDNRSAVMAQSVGGGGGNGGINVSGGIVIDGPLIAGVGGFGGGSGTGDTVNVKAHANLQTEGKEGVGLLAQSIGGGGGAGGLNVSGSLAVMKQGKLPALTVGIGGFGGEGAIAGDVTVDQIGSIKTAGESAHGILAQSIGGGGGTGGMNFAGSVNHTSSAATSSATNLSMLFGMGGFGGEGANAGNVEVSSFGHILTSGDFARGILAQSIGGGGGAGGNNVSTAIAAGGGSPIIVGIGGFGDGGGHAGPVTVNRGTTEKAAGTIKTDGSGATGIEASSIGGGGGTAGFNMMLSFANGGSSNDSAHPDTDSNPWKGKVDDQVIANYDKVIQELNGNNKPAPGGGSTNPYSVQIAVGGNGGSAGDGGDVVVDSHGDIDVSGARSFGLLAQSIGGGGGNANFHLGVGYAPNARSANIKLGGAPGIGGDGGEVQVHHQGDIRTDGNDAIAILAQSIGGGGGNAGLDFDYYKSSAGSVALSLGRVGGEGGTGGDVKVSMDGNISTTGNNAYGLLAQSVGNGGGNSSSTSGSFKAPETEKKDQQSAAVSIGLEGGKGGTGGNVTIDALGVINTDGEKAHALFAQSVGGGGGNGGTADTDALNVSVGGTGGDGGVGGTVKVDNLATLWTSDDMSVGILAQSIGGGGGTGGAAQSGGLKTTGSSLQVAVGGSGGTGAAGGVVTVDNQARIATEGEKSYGIVAQSIGGGGGDASLVINSLENTSEKATRLLVTVGGDGGEGGFAENVSVANSGFISTLKTKAVGILAQSIGGGGGNAESVITESNDSVKGTTLGIGIGGSGGQGGYSGDVNVINRVGPEVDDYSGYINTAGDGAHGIMALSIGGGGGIGSNVVNKNDARIRIPSSGVSPSAISLNVGGSGGDGGRAGHVYVENQGIISTSGKEAHGIIAESIGGGGGNGGLSIVDTLMMGGTDSAINIGGSGGSGNTGHHVVVDNSGLIETSGDNSYGIFAQSVGGGGGNGGTAVATSITPTLVTDLAKSSLLSIGVGGSGGDGATGGDVTVNHSGKIVTHGDSTYGIFAQSVGGGGGTSGISYSTPFWMAVDMTLPLLLGATDGDGGIGGNVTVNSTGNIMTDGNDSAAIHQQAISSGGGNLKTYIDISKDAASLDEKVIDIDKVNSVLKDLTAFIKGKIGLGGERNANNDGGSIDSSHQGDISTSGDNSPGIFLQSVGGGGGSSRTQLTVRPEDAVDFDLQLGAIDSDHVSGGDVTFMRDGNIVTSGMQSKAFAVQSIGGGGGSLAFATNRVDSDGDSGFISPLVQIGAVGGGSGFDGGDVNLTLNGDVDTTGNFAQGLFVQSIGAGGGELMLSGVDAARVSLGAGGGATGGGGTINIVNTGNIFTRGQQAHGVFLQSIGGGGGVMFSDLDKDSVSITLSNEGQGDGGNISYVQHGDILTSGSDTFGIFAQSAGGGGGAVDTLFAGTAGGTGNGGDISLTVEGDISSTGEGSTAVFAQSAGESGKGDIDITLNSKAILGGSGGVGVHIDGENSHLTNHAVLMTTDLIKGMAIRAGDGNDNVDNHGVIIGNIDLGTGANSFYNHEAQSLVSGSLVALGGAGNLLTNAGALSPGGMDTVQHTDLYGDLNQLDSGIYYIDLDFDGNRSDSVQASGPIDIAGEVKINTLNAQRLLPGHHETALMSSEVSLTDHGTRLQANPSAVVDYQLLTPDTQRLVVGFDVDFAPQGLNPNLSAIGEYLNRMQLAGGSEAMNPHIIDFFNHPDLSSLAQTYNYLNPDFYGYISNATIESVRHNVQLLTGRMNSLRYGGTSLYSSSGPSIKNGRGLWLNFSGRKIKQDPDGIFSAYDQIIRGAAAGFDTLIDENKLLGAAIGFSNNDVDLADSLGQSRVKSLNFSIYGNYAADPFYVDGGVSHGRHDGNSSRLSQVLSEFRLAESDHTGHNWTAYSEIGCTYVRQNWLLQPFLGAQYSYLTESGFRETGADALSLMVKRRTTDSLTSDLGMRVQRRFANSKGVLTVGGNMGWNYDFGLDDRSIEASFAGYTDDSFTVHGKKTQRHGLKVGAELNFISTTGIGTSLQYFAERRDGYLAQDIIGQISIPF